MKKFAKLALLLVVPLMAVAEMTKEEWEDWVDKQKPGAICPDPDHWDYRDSWDREWPSTVLLPNPNDCSTFYSCSNGVPILMHCPDNLHFNEQLNVCDWPRNAGCMGLVLGTEKILTKEERYLEHNNCDHAKGISDCKEKVIISVQYCCVMGGNLACRQPDCREFEGSDYK